MKKDSEERECGGRRRRRKEERKKEREKERKKETECMNQEGRISPKVELLAASEKYHNTF